MNTNTNNDERQFGIGVTDIEMNGEQYALIREEDCIGVMPNSRAHADDIPQMRPLGDRVLIKVQETSDETVGGVILTEASKERPLIGTIVRVGPGKAVRGFLYVYLVIIAEYMSCLVKNCEFWNLKKL